MKTKLRRWVSLPAHEVLEVDHIFCSGSKIDEPLIENVPRKLAQQIVKAHNYEVMYMRERLKQWADNISLQVPS